MIRNAINEALTHAPVYSVKVMILVMQALETVL